MKIEFLKDESKKQKKIRRAIIIFLIFIMVMTFFSKTIMNIFLPEVKVCEIEEGTVSNSVRINGVVEAVDPYYVKMHGTRTITSVEALLNNYYEKGDVIYYLDDNIDADFMEEDQELQKKESDYEMYILTNDFSADDKANIESGNITGFDDALSRAQNYRNTRDSKKRNVETVKDELDVLSVEMEKETLTEVEKAVFDYQSKITETEHIRDEKQALLDDASDFYSDICDKISEYEMSDYSSTGEDDESSNSAQQSQIPQYLLTDKENTKSSVDGLKDVIKEIDKTLVQYRYELTKLEEDEAYKSRLLECSEDSVKFKYNAKQAEYEQAELDYTDAVEAYEDYMNTTVNFMNAREMYLDLENFKEDLKKKKEDSFGNAVTMPVSGTIISIPFVAGDVVEDDEVIVGIASKEKGYVLKGSYSQQYQETVTKSTDIITNSVGYYNNLEITYNKSYYNSDDLSTLIAEYKVSADNLKVGDNITVTVLGETQIYKNVIPTTALREDSDGYFVYILECLSLPFGERYIAKKVNVTDVLASNDSYAAIELITDNSFVILDSSKPIDEGEQVRLNNEN